MKGWRQGSNDGGVGEGRHEVSGLNYNVIPVDQLEWERGMPDAITSDPIWKLHAYRTALFLLDLARSDIRVGMKRGLDRDIAVQLLKSSTSTRARSESRRVFES